MSATVLIGAQWGDEGKGKIVDLLSPEFDIVARYQGGANAGHTVIFGDQTVVLHQIPSGIFHPHVRCVIGNGVVIDPAALLEEIQTLESLGVRTLGRLFISHMAHLIMPYHKLLDEVGEEVRGPERVGTTGRGIGPAYVDKFARTGIRVVDLLDRDVLCRKLRANLEAKNELLRRLYGREPLDVEAIIEQYVAFDRMIDPYVTNTVELLNDALEQGQRLLLEGAQGALLDVDFGTYPFVTASHPTAGGACTGLGIPPTAIRRVIGVIKAYTTRVGNGPFPTEIRGELGERLRQWGSEYGATTGRPRRTGWLDLVSLRHAVRVNGIQEIALTKLDVLDPLAEIPVCVAYRIGNKTTTVFPVDVQTLERVEPVYEVLPGWQTSTAGVTNVTALPDRARAYVAFISDWLRLPVRWISTGPKREQTIPCA
ncbi:MAG: adenylosuccinate synthase [Bacteroidetes bacterium]|nr:adenylosuccinate synthase [Rhodothermia bacterium]MCS7154900.1 adenylosuccinate synthase [Bacteroidota bacterium]MCX7906941.1 adenylosuccinate synthase [Bacteroidota bacterium]MDW8137695.1 adenylosuccinate synthase [Bacteroidota bacterium]MDW8285351.1 adenylosuccinate synthase [Bacteroidota bacterium]